MKTLSKVALFVLTISLLSTSTLYAINHLVCDPNPTAGHYLITLLNDPADAGDDILYEFPAEDDGSLNATLVGFPAGLNQLEVRAANVWAISTMVPFEFSKDMPGIPSNIALVYIDGTTYFRAMPQVSITSYRIIVDGVDYIVDAEADGSLLYEVSWLANGAHSIESYAINQWGESSPVPFNFTKTLSNAPENLRLQQQ